LCRYFFNIYFQKDFEKLNDTMMMSRTIQLHDKHFELYLTESQINTAVQEIADRINVDYIGKRPLIIPVLNGSFMFAADLMKKLTIDCEISFIKASSYHGTSTTGTVNELIGLNEPLAQRHVIILEDIIDTGTTLARLTPTFELQLPASLKIASLLHKPLALKADIRIDYVGIEIPNDFIVGYGLDYDGLGRNLREIYKVAE
jgi:hypoxanthine phosphoribosyltransferase